MNKLHNIFLILLLAGLNINSQKKAICGEVYYTYITDISSVYIENYLMKFTNNFSFSKEVKIMQLDEGKEKVESEQGTTYNIIAGRENITPQFFYNNKNEFYFREIFYDETLLVKEDTYQWQWQLHPDTKKIGAFVCQKATTTFRGRDYIAWFTNEIPVPFGPWKFKDLPGLILEVYDIDNAFHLTAKNIKVGNFANCNINIDKNLLKTTLTISGYLKRRKELINAYFAMLSAKMGRTKPLKLDENCDDCSEGIEKFN